MGTIALVMKWVRYHLLSYRYDSICYEMGTIALVMKWYDNSSYEMGTITLLMNWVRWLLL